MKGTKKARNIKASLRPYQEQGFQWLWFLHEIGSGGIPAAGIGLGKTVPTLPLPSALKSAGGTGAKACLVAGESAGEKDAKADCKKKFKALIVAPTSVVTNWERELDKFSPSL